MTKDDMIELMNDKAWEEAKGYVESNDIDSLEQQVKNETKIMVELAHDYNKLKKRLKWLAIGSGIAAVASGIIFYKFGEQNAYKSIIGLADEDCSMFVRDKKTNLLYSIKSEHMED